MHGSEEGYSIVDINYALDFLALTSTPMKYSECSLTKLAETHLPTCSEEAEAPSQFIPIWEAEGELEYSGQLDRLDKEMHQILELICLIF